MPSLASCPWAMSNWAAPREPAPMVFMISLQAMWCSMTRPEMVWSRQPDRMWRHCQKMKKGFPCVSCLACLCLNLLPCWFFPPSFLSRLWPLWGFATSWALIKIKGVLETGWGLDPDRELLINRAVRKWKNVLHLKRRVEHCSKSVADTLWAEESKPWWYE